ncbi:hypothetical protein EDF58_11551, partial [Novosphingobium sp. PhB57]
MAKTPTKASAKRAPAQKSPSKTPSKKAPSDVTAADIGGETPAKADPVPADAAISHSYAETQGSGGETRQSAGEGVAALTTQQGVPVSDDQNSL